MRIWVNQEIHINTFTKSAKSVKSVANVNKKEDKIQETEGRRQNTEETENERWGNLGSLSKRRPIATGFFAKQTQFP